MDLEQFLQAGGADLAALVEQVDATVSIEPGDYLLVVGSLVEGLGTTRSDLDLLLITSRPEDRLPGEEEKALVAGRCLADVRILPRTELDALLARLDAWRRQPWDLRHAVRFSQAERVLLHRLLHGPLVAHGADADPGAVPRPAGQAVARLKLHVARHLARTVQVDMAGHRDGEDAASLVYAAQDLLGHAVDALTAAHGLTNPNPKWRGRLLRELPGDWQAPLGIRPTGESAQDAVWRLHRAPERPEMAAALGHALRITAFTRAVVLWAERRLVRRHPAPPLAGTWPARNGGAPLPHLDLDVDVVPGDGGGAQAARLNAFGTPLQLSPRELALALLFDGATTPNEAEAAVCGAAGAHGNGPAHALASRFSAANLSLS
jgi:hypothetical protein